MIFQARSSNSQPAPEKKDKAEAIRPRQTAAQHSIISADLTIKGNLVCTSDLRIEGRVDGDITCRTLTLGAQPVINSKVTAETVRVCGEFAGEIHARKVILTDAARIKGDIYQDVLQMEKGAVLEGYVGRLDNLKATSEGRVSALKSA